MLSLTKTASDRAKLTRLRKWQRLINANLNAIASRLSGAGDLCPTPDQWTDLWDDLEPAGATLRQLAEELLAADGEARVERRGRHDVRRPGTDTEDAS